MAQQRQPYQDRDWFKGMHTGGQKARLELTDLQKAFIEFLVDPDPGKPTQTKWCEQNDLTARTAFRWKKERLFKDEWEKRAYEVYGGPERVNQVVNALFASATNGDVKAMQLYLQYVDKFTPKREVVSTTRELADLSDEELINLGDNVTALRARKSS